MALEAPTLRQVSKPVEAQASDFPQAAAPAVTTLAEEMAAEARRIARSDAWLPSAPRGCLFASILFSMFFAGLCKTRGHMGFHKTRFVAEARIRQSCRFA